MRAAASPTPIQRRATSSAGSTSPSRRATRTYIYAQVQSIAPNNRRLRQRARLPARRLGDDERRHDLVVHGRLGQVLRWAAAATTTRRTGTTRGSPSTRTTRTASSSTPTTSGSRPARARRSTTSPAATTAAGRVVHVDQHALAFVPGSSSILTRRERRRRLREPRNANLDPPGPTDLVQHGHRPEHDRVLLGRHQRQLRDLAESVGRRRRAGQRPQRGRLHRLPDRPGAVADDDRRRRLLRAHRPRRHRNEPALLRREQQRRHVALRQQLPDRRLRVTRASPAAGAATRSRSSCPSTSSTAASRAATTARPPARRAAAAISSPARPGSGRRSPAATQSMDAAPGTSRTTRRRRT